MKLTFLVFSLNSSLNVSTNQQYGQRLPHTCFNLLDHPKKDAAFWTFETCTSNDFRRAFDLKPADKIGDK